VFASEAFIFMVDKQFMLYRQGVRGANNCCIDIVFISSSLVSFFFVICRFIGDSPGVITVGDTIKGIYKAEKYI